FALSFPGPSTILLIAVPNAIAMLLVIPLQLLNVPGLRFTDEFDENPLRSSVLLVPESQIARIGSVFCEKSKNIAVGPAILQLKPNVCPPENGVEVGNPYRAWTARMSSSIKPVGSLP